MTRHQNEATRLFVWACESRLSRTRPANPLCLQFCALTLGELLCSTATYVARAVGPHIQTKRWHLEGPITNKVLAKKKKILALNLYFVRTHPAVASAQRTLLMYDRAHNSRNRLYRIIYNQTGANGPKTSQGSIHCSRCGHKKLEMTYTVNTWRKNILEIGSGWGKNDVARLLEQIVAQLIFFCDIGSKWLSRYLKQVKIMTVEIEPRNVGLDGR